MSNSFFLLSPCLVHRAFTHQETWSLLAHAVSPGRLLSAQMLLVLYVYHRTSIVVSFTQFVRVELSKRVLHLSSDSFDSFFGEADTRER